MQASNKDVLAAYSKFYGTLLAAGYDSWQDYLLDQLLMARDNPLARSIAQGNMEDDAPIMTALAHDLDVLQVRSMYCMICVGEQCLSQRACAWWKYRKHFHAALLASVAVEQFRHMVCIYQT